MKLSSLKYILGLSIMLFLGITQTRSQNFVGAQIDNRAGIRGLTLNPANVVNPRLKAELNIFSVSAYVGNDYIGVNLSDLPSFRSLAALQDGVDINAKPDNNFVGNVDILGPSFQINLSEKHSLAISTRVRTFFNLNNIGGEFLEAVSGDEEDIENFEVAMRDLDGIVHAWGEIGLTYGRMFVDNDKYNLKGAVTLKYLGGAGGVLGSSDVLGAIYFQTPNTLTTRGNLNYGYTSDFDIEDVSFGDITSGFGADIGFIFELDDQSNRAYSDGYKFRGGISIMDIGGINYSEFNQWDYDMDNTVSLDEFDENNFQDVLEENYNGTRTVQKSSLGMPTSLQIFADYAITNKFYVSGHGSISIRNHGDLPVSQVVNRVSITPRFESGWISVYSPVSFTEYEGGVSWGVGLRLGPVIIGSGSILTNILSKNSRSVDAYFGIQIPFYNKGRRADDL